MNVLEKTVLKTRFGMLGVILAAVIDVRCVRLQPQAGSGGAGDAGTISDVSQRDCP
jgi:hypothetical protein